MAKKASKGKAPKQLTRKQQERAYAEFKQSDVYKSNPTLTGALPRSVGYSMRRKG